MKKTAGDLKKGDFIYHQNDIWQVQKTEFNFQGRGQATMRTRLKNVTSNKNVDNNYKTGDGVETVDVDVVEMQYLYKNTHELHFMNPRSYEQLSLPTSLVGHIADYLREGDKYWILMHDDKPLSMRPPASVRLKVTETESAVKGDTVSGAKKPAVLETGVTVMVPLFIKTGEVIVVNPETGEYSERVKS